MGKEAYIYNLFSNDSGKNYIWRQREKTNVKKC